MEINKMIGSCGLACMLCSEKIKKACDGCTSSKINQCNIKACCDKLKINGCHECDDFPCDQDMFKSKRVCAFNKCAKEMGVEKLIACLDRNDKAGIKYHKEDGSKGDYDKLDTEQEIIKLIKRGE